MLSRALRGVGLLCFAQISGCAQAQDSVSAREDTLEGITRVCNELLEQVGREYKSVEEILRNRGRQAQATKAFKAELPAESRDRIEKMCLASTMAGEDAEALAENLQKFGIDEANWSSDLEDAELAEKKLGWPRGTLFKERFREE